jgi:hypothetical protein
VKDRWVFCVKPDSSRSSALAVDDNAAIRHWRQRATEAEQRWSLRSLNIPRLDFGEA